MCVQQGAGGVLLDGVRASTTLSVSRRAVMAGTTGAAAIRVTPKICIDAINAAASNYAKNVSTQSVLTLYTRTTSESNVVKRSCLYMKKITRATSNVTPATTNTSSPVTPRILPKRAASNERVKRR